MGCTPNGVTPPFTTPTTRNPVGATVIFPPLAGAGAVVPAGGVVVVVVPDGGVVVVVVPDVPVPVVVVPDVPVPAVVDGGDDEVRHLLPPAPLPELEEPEPELCRSASCCCSVATSIA